MADAIIYAADPEVLDDLCMRNQKKLFAAADYIKSERFDRSGFLKIVDQITSRTDCIRCANCCKILRTILDKEDISRIAKELDMNMSCFSDKYLEPYDDTHLEIARLPCFLLSENRCRIYPARPNACKSFPYLEGIDNYSTHALMSNAKNCPIVYNVLCNIALIDTK